MRLFGEGLFARLRSVITRKAISFITNELIRGDVVVVCLLEETNTIVIDGGFESRNTTTDSVPRLCLDDTIQLMLDDGRHVPYG